MEFALYLDGETYFYSEFLGIDFTINTGVLIGIVAIGYAIKLLRKDIRENGKLQSRTTQAKGSPRQGGHNRRV